MTIAISRSTDAELRVARTDIQFKNLSFERVRIEITVRNEGDALSRPTWMRVEAAHFGAFLPWRPLTQRMLPPIPAGGRRTIAFEARRPDVQPLGEVDDVSPTRLLTAVADDDGRPRALPADMFQLLARRQAHWLGNINVFIGKQAVERHMARALRVHAGKNNLAMFFLGRRRDAYCMDVQGDAASWEPTFWHAAGGRAGLLDFCRMQMEPLEPGRWLECRRTRLVLVTMSPPAQATRGKLDVHVRQRSTGACAVVEFDLDTRAAGPGCFTV